MIDVAYSGPARSRTRQKNLLRRLLAHPAGSIFLVFAMIQLACIIWAVLNPDGFRYLSPQNLAILMRAVPVLGCLALGVGILMIAGEFDLSVGGFLFPASGLPSLQEIGTDGFRKLADHLGSKHHLYSLLDTGLTHVLD